MYSFSFLSLCRSGFNHTSVFVRIKRKGNIMLSLSRSTQFLCLLSIFFVFHCTVLAKGDVLQKPANAVLLAKQERIVSDIEARKLSTSKVSFEKLCLDFLDFVKTTKAKSTLKRYKSVLNNFKTFLKEAADEYDYVFVDAPPVLPVADASEIAPQVDGVKERRRRQSLRKIHRQR